MWVVAMDRLGYQLRKQIQNREVHMMDINERAIALSQKNAQVNGVQNVRIFESDGLSVGRTGNTSCCHFNKPANSCWERYGL